MSLRRSGRSRQWTAKMKVVDDETRYEASKKRIESLESDNFAFDEDIYDPKDQEFMLSEDAVQPSTKKKKTEKEARRARERRFKAPSSVKSFNQLLEFERFELYPPHVPTYRTIEAPRSKFPSPQICYVCGQESGYTCPRCGLRFCRIRCNEEHKENRCLKFIQ